MAHHQLMTISGKSYNVQLIEPHLIVDDISYRLVTCVYGKQNKWGKNDKWYALNIDVTTNEFSVHIHSRIFRFDLQVFPSIR